MLRVGEGLEDQLHAHLVVGDGKLADDFFLARGGVLENTFGKADLFGDTLCNDIEDVVVLHVKQLVLDRGTAAIDDEYDHGYKN